MQRSVIWSSLAVALLAAVPAHADVKAGVDAWGRGDYVTAVREWRTLAIAGDPEAQFNLGQAYRLGRGVATDPKLAEDWLRKAAFQGNLPARDAYGLILFQNGKRADALPFIEESAGRGEPRAQYVYGTALFNGDMVQKDWVRAYALMTRASAAGIPAASASLAQMDKFIPLDQRQRGLALAQAFASTGAPIPTEVASSGAPPVIATEDLPPSRPVAPPKPIKAKPPVVAVKAPTSRQPVIEPPAPSGGWKVQLAAFGDASKAQSLWGSLHSRIATLGPYRSFIVTAGPITRLQAGPLPSRAAAEKLCASIKAAGQPCLPVAP